MDADSPTATTPSGNSSASSQRVSYKDFVRDYMSKLNRTEIPDAKERLKLTAGAWQQLPAGRKLFARDRNRGGDHPAGGEGSSESPATGAAAAAAGAATGGGVVKAKTWSELPTMLTHLTQRGGATPRRAKLTLQCTKARQRQFNLAARAFTNEIKAGKILSANDAFLAGVNAVTRLCSL